MTAQTPEQPRCPKCGAIWRVNRDGTIRIHRIPRSTSWGRGKSDYCPTSGTTPYLWGLEMDVTPRAVTSPDLPPSTSG